MNPKTIIYLHGFNSASRDLNGNLLINKQKLAVMDAFCAKKNIQFDSPNIDYRDFQNIVEDLLIKYNEYLDQGREVILMGSSMGGFTSEYLAMKTGCKAILINPAIHPSQLLPQFIGVTENFETGQPYHWDRDHCEQYRRYEQELAASRRMLDLTFLLDLGDELLDAGLTLEKYQAIAKIKAFDGGSHSFEHIEAALPLIEQTLSA